MGLLTSGARLHDWPGYRAVLVAVLIAVGRRHRCGGRLRFGLIPVGARQAVGLVRFVVGHRTPPAGEPSFGRVPFGARWSAVERHREGPGRWSSLCSLLDTTRRDGRSASRTLRPASRATVGGPHGRLTVRTCRGSFRSRNSTPAIISWNSLKSAMSFAGGSLSSFARAVGLAREIGRLDVGVGSDPDTKATE